MKRRGEKWLVPVSLHRLVRYRYEDSFQLTWLVFILVSQGLTKVTKAMNGPDDFFKSLYAATDFFSYLRVQFLELCVLLVHLEVDLGRGDGDGAAHGDAGAHQDGGGADVDRH